MLIFNTHSTVITRTRKVHSWPYAAWLRIRLFLLQWTLETTYPKLLKPSPNKSTPLSSPPTYACDFLITDVSTWPRNTGHTPRPEMPMSKVSSMAYTIWTTTIRHGLTWNLRTSLGYRIECLAQIMGVGRLAIRVRVVQQLVMILSTISTGSLGDSLMLFLDKIMTMPMCRHPSKKTMRILCRRGYRNRSSVVKHRLNY